MATVTESITVNCPVSTTYDQWTRFEEFPDFMDGVRSVQQIDDAHLHWAAEIDGKRHEWDAEITEQRPDQVVAWRALDGFYTSGRVVFEPLDQSTTKITVELECEPEGVTEALGARLGEENRRVAGDLDRFKELVESRGAKDERVG